MKRGSNQLNKRPTDSFGEFKKAARAAFAFLASPPYNCQEHQTVIRPPECSINYLNKTTGVTVSYEWGGSPSVVLTKLKHGSALISEGEQIGLKFIVMERCPSRVDRFDRNVGDDLEGTLKDHAQILKECGYEILTGDFEMFPRLKQLAIEEEYRANLELFGSGTGEIVQN